MTLTRVRLAEVESRGYPFCGFWVVGYFLGLSWNQVDHLYESGQLPRALCPDGSAYRPSGERLVLAEKFADSLPAERRAEFDLWRKGGFEIAPATSRDSQPPPVGSHQTASVSSTAPLTVSRSNAPDFGCDLVHSQCWTWPKQS